MCYFHFGDSNSTLIKYQHGHKFYFYAISMAIATTTLKFSKFGIGNIKADVARWWSTR